jgi:hypothetical protein
MELRACTGGGGREGGWGSIIKYRRILFRCVFLVIARRNIQKSKQNYSNTLNGHDNVFLCFYSINTGKHNKTLFNRGTFYWG